MFIIKLLSQHVLGIIMPIFRRTRLCITAYGVLHCLCWLWLCGIVEPNSTQPQPAQPVQNTICSYTQSCSPEDGHNDARNKKFHNKHQISCILLVSLSSPYVHHEVHKSPATGSCLKCSLPVLIIQGDSVARGPRLLPIKNYVIEIMT